MQSSRMRTACSLTVSRSICHACPPLPCMPPCHACLPTMHASPAMHTLCHACSLPCMPLPCMLLLPCPLPCTPLPCTPSAMQPPVTHTCHACPLLPCISRCQTCPLPHTSPTVHAPLLCIPLPCTPPTTYIPHCGQTDTCENITFPNFICSR